MGLLSWKRRCGSLTKKTVLWVCRHRRRRRLRRGRGSSRVLFVLLLSVWLSSMTIGFEGRICCSRPLLSKSFPWSPISSRLVPRQGRLIREILVVSVNFSWLWVQVDGVFHLLVCLPLFRSLFCMVDIAGLQLEGPRRLSQTTATAAFGLAQTPGFGCSGRCQVC